MKPNRLKVRDEFYSCGCIWRGKARVVTCSAHARPKTGPR